MGIISLHIGLPYIEVKSIKNLLIYGGNCHFNVSIFQSIEHNVDEQYATQSVLNTTKGLAIQWWYII
jgi:hypothetical protein